MGTPLGGLWQIAEILHPNTLKQLRNAGALGAKSPLAVGAALPWLIGRGPSLAILCHMNSIVVGDKPAIHDRIGSISWADLNKRVNRVVRALDSVGVEPGDHVALLLRNGREMVEVALAAQRFGVVACPLNTWAKPTELEATIRNSRPVVLFYDTAHCDIVEQCAPENIPLIAVGSPDGQLPKSAGYEELIAERGTHPPAPFVRRRGTPKVVIQTSGTTGTPKAASRDAAASGLGVLANLLQVVPYRRDDIVYCPAPLFHSFGLATFTFATALGATLVLPRRFDPEGSLELIEKHRCTAASFVPVMMRRILSLPDDVKSKYDLSSLRVVMASGSVLSNDVRRGATELFGSVLFDLYGSTEAGWVAIATPEDMLKDEHTVGRPVPGIDVRVVDADDNPQPTGETGEIYIRSKVMFEGYISGESTKNTGDGWMSTGDLGHLDDDGFIYIDGRADDMVVVGGENVYPVEIEQVIEDLGGVEEVAVVGVADDDYGQILAAFVAGSVTAGDVIDACKKELASYKVPKRVHILEELPRNATGKILKRELIDSSPSN
ncbi:long-chain-fatty-acid--CoA ligase FadD2 [soil metagenome]